jgi:hypothetical protein
MTVRKPFSDSPEMGAKKLPAAAVGRVCIHEYNNHVRADESSRTIHHKVDASKLLNCLIDRDPNLLRLADVRLDGDAHAVCSVGELSGRLLQALKASATMSIAPNPTHVRRWYHSLASENDGICTVPHLCHSREHTAQRDGC